MNKKIKCLVTFFVCCAIFLVPHKISAQSTCPSAIQVFGSNTDSLQNVQDEWFSFKATSTLSDIKVIDLAPTQANVTSLEVYSGTCSSLTLIGSDVDTIAPIDSLSLSLSGLTIGNIYYLKVKRNDPVSCGTCAFGTFAPFSLLVTNVAYITITGAFGSCSQDAFNHCTVNVCIGSQLCFSLDPTSIANGGTGKWNITGSSCPVIQTLLAADTFCCTFNTLGSFTAKVKHTDALGNIAFSPVATINVIPAPNSSLVISNLNPCAGDTVCFTINSNITNYTTNTFQWIVDGNLYSSCNIFGCSNTLCFPDNIYSTPLLSPGAHSITVIVNNEAGCIDTVVQDFFIKEPNLFFTHDNKCRMRFDADTSCANAFVSYHWNFGDPASGISDTASGFTVFHDFTVLATSYTVTLTAVDIYGVTHTYSATVHPSPGPSATITGLATNNCSGAPLTYTAPCNTGITYGWIILNGSTFTTSANNCSITVDWNVLGDTMILVATDTLRDCISRDTIYIPKCCSISGFAYNPITHPNGIITLDNTSASAVLQNPLYAALITGTTFSATPNKIIINGVFTIDTTFRFYLCKHIDPGGNALIDDLPTRTFTIDSSLVTNECDIMWEGIRVTDSTARVDIVRSSIVRNARNCIHSYNGGRYSVDRSEIQNCVRGIVIEFFNKPNPSIIRQSKIKFTAFLPAIPPLPTWEQKTLVGIYVTDNSKMTFGDSTKTVYRNTFDNLYNGIQVYRSGVNIQNNDFKNITFNSLAPSNIPTGFGIDATGGRIVAGNPFLNLRVGSSTYSATTQNNFNNCTDGIRVFAQGNVNILGNNFSKIADICADVTQDNANIAIYRNLVNNGTMLYKIGFRVRNSGNGFVNISNNNIIQGNMITSNNRSGVGILFETTSPSASPTKARIKYNNITRNRVGIWLRNVAPVTADSILLRGNTIDMLTNWSVIGLPTLPHTGISLQNCSGIFADTNSVVTAGNFAPTGSDTLIRGILVENTSFSVLSDNTVKKMQSGIMARNNAFAVFYVCNTLQKNNNGFFFTGTSGSALVAVNEIYNPSTSTPAPTGNHFISNGVGLRGSISPPITWYFDVTNPTGANAITGVNFTSLSSSLLICGQFYLPPFGGGGGGTTRTTTVGTAITSASQVASDTGNVYYSNLYSLRQLRMNPSWLSLNLPDDTLYQNFYVAKNNSCLGGLCNVDDQIRTGNCSSACSINSALNPICTKDQNQKTVNEIYFRSWDQGQVWFAPQDSATLLSIALTNPQEGGEAVYSARVMLGLDQEEYGNASSMRIAHIENSATEEAFKVYPNPASDNVTIDYKLDDGQIGNYEIINLSGQRVQSGYLQSGTTSQQISTSQLSVGVYTVKLTVDGEMIGNEKLVIIRQ